METLLPKRRRIVWSGPPTIISRSIVLAIATMAGVNARVVGLHMVVDVDVDADVDVDVRVGGLTWHLQAHDKEGFRHLLLQLQRLHGGPATHTMAVWCRVRTRHRLQRLSLGRWRLVRRQEAPRWGLPCRTRLHLHSLLVLPLLHCNRSLSRRRSYGKTPSQCPWCLLHLRGRRHRRRAVRVCLICLGATLRHHRPVGLVSRMGVRLGLGLGLGLVAVAVAVAAVGMAMRLLAAELAT